MTDQYNISFNDYLNLHEDHRDWLTKTLPQYQNKKIIVMTHHLPSFQCIHPVYKNEFTLNRGYASDLEDLFQKNILVWCFGHTHESIDIEVKGTRLLCVPFGYPSEQRSKATKFTIKTFSIA